MSAGPGPEPGGAQEPPVVRDRRRIDPVTGEVRQAVETADLGQAASAPTPQGVGVPADSDSDTGPHADGASVESGDSELAAAQAESAQRLDDLRRLQAEFVNYRRRVDRDAGQAREQGVASVAEALLPVLDDIALARQHGDAESGPFKSVADNLDAALRRVGVERYGVVGEPFDPTVHEALMHDHSDEVEVATCVQILQPGYRVGERILRAARVAVADPG